MKVNKKGMPMIIIGILLIISALIFTGYNYYLSYTAGKSSEDVIEQLDRKMIIDSGYSINKNMEMPTVSINGNEYIGEIEFPSLQLKLPVMNEWSYDNLNIAPCRFSGSIYKSNMVIAGHNYKTHFGKLRELSIGDTVKFTDADGNIFLYEVKDMEILPPSAVDEMEKSDWDLTLFTCTVGAKTRLAVRCQLSSSSVTVI
jgi:sortase A